MILLGIVSGFFQVSASAEVLEKSFFYRDIHNFLGLPYESRPFGEVQSIAQPFHSRCSGLNRVILPFFIHENSSGILTFNLYRVDGDSRLIFSVPIDISELPSPALIGTHAVKGVLHYVWIPEQIDSKEKSYVWEVVKERTQEQAGVGIYLTNRHSQQVGQVIIDGAVQDNAYVAFYTYCQYRFSLGEVLTTTWGRLMREKYFVGFYFFLVGGLAVYLKIKK